MKVRFPSSQFTLFALNDVLSFHFLHIINPDEL